MRRHLFEFTDLQWFPRVLRDAMTGYLEACYRIMRPPVEWADKITAAAHATNESRVLDLCSGAGGPILPLLPELRAKLGPQAEVVLSDLYPSDEAIQRVAALHDPLVRYEPAPVDATRLPDNPPGVRTLFAGFHHLRPADARAVLAAAVADRRAICVFEVSENSWRGVLSALPIPIMVLVLTPLVRPLRVWQLVFTYLLPVLPLLIWWDGLVSQLRTYSPDELRELISTLDRPDYEWNIGSLQAPGVPLHLPYLVGTPK